MLDNSVGPIAVSPDEFFIEAFGGDLGITGWSVNTSQLEGNAPSELEAVADSLGE